MVAEKSNAIYFIYLYIRYTVINDDIFYYYDIIMISFIITKIAVAY